MNQKHWPSPLYSPKLNTPLDNKKFQEITSALEEDGCIKNTFSSNGKADLPPEIIEKLSQEEYFTQVEIPGKGKDGVYTHLGYYTPPVSIASFCNVKHYANWNYGTDNSPNWQEYHHGN